VGADDAVTTSPENIAPCVPGSAMEVRAVFLVGFMASGKSSIGQELARRLGWDFVDLDTRIESRERQTVPEIFRDRGEPGFRLAETSALRDLLTGSLEQDSVVALGGGAFVQERNRELLRPWPTVFLEAPAAELWQRSLTDGIERPLRGDPEQFARLYAERLPFYRQAAVVAAICVLIEAALQLGGTPEDAAWGLSRIDGTSFGTGESQ
jgi:shikimate kinase